MDMTFISYHESMKSLRFMDMAPNLSLQSMKSLRCMDWVCDVCEKGLAKCQPFEILYASQRLLLVNALVVSAALRTCLATEWTLSTWLRTSLSCLRHIL